MTFKTCLENYCLIRAIVLPKDFLIEQPYSSITMVFRETYNILVDSEDWEIPFLVLLENIYETLTNIYI